MSTRADIAERHVRILADLADRGHALACRLHDDAMAASEPDERASLAAAFHQVARTVRQTLALEAKLDRDLKRAEREERDHAQAATQTAVRDRKARLGATVRRLVWSEAEAGDAQRLEDTLEDLLDEDALDPSFLDQTLDAQVARLTRDLDLHEPHDPEAPRRFVRKRRDRNETVDYLSPATFPFQVVYGDPPPDAPG